MCDKNIQKKKNIIKKMIQKEKTLGYGGIDIALDSDKLCLCDDNLMRQLIDWVNQEYSTYDIEYFYNERSINLGYCSHHLSIRW